LELYPLTPRLYDDVDDACRERKRERNFEHENPYREMVYRTHRKKMASERKIIIIIIKRW
jgi:hypothetical protein